MCLIILRHNKIQIIEFKPHDLDYGLNEIH